MGFSMLVRSAMIVSLTLQLSFNLVILSRFYNQYVDRAALLYLILANEILHTLHPNIITIAEDATLYPGLCEPTSQGGLGFDYFVNTRASEMWLWFLENVQDSNWSMSKIVETLVEISGSSDKNNSLATVKSLPKRKEDFDEESDGREKFDQNVDLARTINHMKIDGVSSEVDLDEDDDEVDPTCCFMCDQKHKTIESCMVHMHKQHGLFIPDIEYLKDPEGLLTYLGEKVKRDYTCLYCNINCQPFESLEAVRMHMVAKSHCRVHYGDATDEEEEPELDEFYDYSSSYVDGKGQQLVATDGISNSITLGCGGSELVITRATNDGVSTKALGSREYLRYYRQKPRPSPDSVPVTSLQAARSRSIGSSTLQLKEKMERMKLMKQIMKQMNRSEAKTMRCKMSMR